MFSIEGDLVLDPFLGSGTTLKAAMDLNRRLVGYEKLEDFSRIIRERMGHESERIVFQKQSVIEQVTHELTA
jgi:DNA modification methylase